MPKCPPRSGFRDIYRCKVKNTDSRWKPHVLQGFATGMSLRFAQPHLK